MMNRGEACSGEKISYSIKVVPKRKIRFYRVSTNLVHSSSRAAPSASSLCRCSPTLRFSFVKLVSRRDVASRPQVLYSSKVLKLPVPVQTSQLSTLRLLPSPSQDHIVGDSKGDNGSGGSKACNIIIVWPSKSSDGVIASRDAASCRGHLQKYGADVAKASH